MCIKGRGTRVRLARLEDRDRREVLMKPIQPGYYRGDRVIVYSLSRSLSFREDGSHLIIIPHIPKPGVLMASRRAHIRVV